MTLRITKYTEKAEHEYSKLTNFPKFVRPRMLDKVWSVDSTAEEPIGYSYNFVHGQHPTDWQAVMATAIPFWNVGEKLPILVGEYQKHCIDVAKEVLSSTDYLEFSSLLHRGINIEDLTPVANCHGDLTFANCIQHGCNITFIDPGNDYGMPCQELDESKILQSVKGWDVVAYGAQQPIIYPFMRVRKIHWVLLATHLVRLLRYDHPMDAKKWARETLKSVMNSLYDIQLTK